MTTKEKFLAIQTYDEYDRRRNEFKGLDGADKDILRHLADIAPKTAAPFGKDGEIIYYHEKKSGGKDGKH